MDQLVPATRVIEILNTADEALTACGHTRKTFIDPRTGTVCLAGALVTAIVDPHLQLSPEERGIQMFQFQFHWDYLAAAQVVAAVLPDYCCGAVRNRTVKIFHYNDRHCDGAADARSVLREAREKLEAEL